MDLHATSTYRSKFLRLPSRPLAVALTLWVAFVAGPAVPALQKAITDPNEAERLLKDGNERFRDFKLEHPHLDKKRRDSLVEGKQQPFAIIFGCVDSRVPAELVFDRGLGDLLVIRTAGQVLDSAALGSIEYGVAVLGAPLIVVLGHKNCGAVQDTIKTLDSRGAQPGYIASLVNAIRPAVERARRQPGDRDQLLDRAIRENVALGVEQLKTSQILAEAIRANKLKIVGAHYDLGSGAVDITVR